MKHVAFLIVLVAGAVGLSLILIPGQEELGLMHLKGRDFGAARERFEVLLRGSLTDGSGDGLADGLADRSGAREAALTVGAVQGLNDVYIHAGDIERAISVTERLLEERPDDVALIELLLGFYRQAQRPDDVVRSLERLARTDPTPERLRELAAHYDYTDRVDDERRMLARLVAGPGSTSADHQKLARLRAASGDVRGAAEMLYAIWAIDESSLTLETLLLLVNLLIDSGEDERLNDVATRSVAGFFTPEVTAHVVGILAARDRTELASALLDPWGTRLVDFPELLALATRLDFEGGNPHDALDRLNVAAQGGRLPPNLVRLLIETAHGLGKVEVTFEHLASTDAAALAEWVLPGLAEAAVARGRTDIAERLLEAGGDDLRRERPVLAAAVSLANADEAGAQQWIERAADANLSTPLSPPDRLALVDIALRLVDRQLAARSLAPLELLDLPAGAIHGLGARYRELDVVIAGLEALDESGGEFPSPAHGVLWAELAAGASWEVAIRAASRAYEKRPDGTRRLQLAETLLAADRLEEALAQLRFHEAGGVRLDGRYRAAVRQARRRGLAVPEDLEQPGSSVGSAEDKLRRLRAEAEAGPGAAGSGAGGERYYALRDAALALNRRDIVTDFIIAQFADSDLADSVREGWLHDLRELAPPETALAHMRAHLEWVDLPAEKVEAWFDDFRETALAAGRGDHIAARAGAPQRQSPHRVARGAAWSRLSRGSASLPAIDGETTRSRPDHSGELVWALPAGRPRSRTAGRARRLPR